MGKMAEGRRGKKKAKKEEDLLKLIFSRSLDVIFNRSLFKSQVVKIPDTFDSLEAYLNSFKYSVPRRTSHRFLFPSWSFFSRTLHKHALSRETQVTEAPFYRITVGSVTCAGKDEVYRLKKGDIFAQSDAKPMDFSDFDQYGNPYNVSLVTKGGDDDYCYLVDAKSL